MVPSILSGDDMNKVYAVMYVRTNLAGAKSLPQLCGLYKKLGDAAERINMALQRQRITWEQAYITVEGVR